MARANFVSRPRKGDHIRRVGIIFAGGPAPAANAVISSAAVSFLDDGREVLGFMYGYENLQRYHSVTARLKQDEHYKIFAQKDVTGSRNAQGISIGTSRANPGKGISSPADLDNPEKTAKLKNVYSAFIDLGISKTRDRNGILVFVAAFEQRVEVVSDVGVDTARVGAAWTDACSALLKSMKPIPRLDLFLTALRSLGPALGAAMPRKADDVNELPDEVA